VPRPSVALAKEDTPSGLLGTGITSRKIHQEGFNIKIWQRNYYEHAIRNEIELDKLKQTLFYGIGIKIIPKT